MIKVSGSAVGRIDRSCPEYKALLDAHSRLAKKDTTLWGKQAQAEAAIRLNWVDLPNNSRELLPTLDALAAKHRDKTVFILCGMGGSSLGPEVIATTHEKNLFVLDSTDPGHVQRALENDLAKTLVIISSKSGTTIETMSHRSIFEAAFRKKSLEPTSHMVFVTDPGSPLDHQVRKEGFSVVNADPHVGGRFSVLSAFGLVPASLIGVDVSVLLDDANDAKTSFLLDPHLVCDIAFLLAHQSNQYVAFNDSGSGMSGLSDWIEQLIAESTGKNQVGRLPVVVKDFKEVHGGNCFNVAFSGNADLVVEAGLSAQFILWEWVTSLLCFALKVDPFNQPNVTEAKDATSALLSQWNGSKPLFTADHVEASVEIYGKGTSTKDALNVLIASVPTNGYIAVMAYLDRFDDADLVELQSILSEKADRPVTFGWGPRFLHSTGQFHKGGQQNGVFLQITGGHQVEIKIPGAEFDLSTLIAAQALGDANALTMRNYPLLRFNLKSRKAGIAEIIAAAKSL
jgi:glucose-6-phosphate isomerase